MAQKITDISAGEKHYVAIKLPFHIGSSGAVEDTTDLKAIWDDRVRSVLLTAHYERVGIAEFGSSIYEEIMNNSGGIFPAEDRISDAIYDAFAKFLPALTLSSVESKFSMDDGIMEITITYILPNDVSTAITINSLSMRGNFPPDITSVTKIEGDLHG